MRLSPRRHYSVIRQEGWEEVADDYALEWATGMRLILESSLESGRVVDSQLTETLKSSLFLGIFSAYDAFLGDLLTAIYGKKPELFNNVKQEIPVAEVLRYDSFAELKAAVVNDEVESLRRRGYVEQFECLEKTLRTKLREFDRWP
jgi:hypothetical protein